MKNFVVWSMVCAVMERGLISGSIPSLMWTLTEMG